MAHLFADDVRIIRLYAKAGHSIKEIAERSGLTRDRVSDIVNRNTYAHVVDAPYDPAKLPPIESGLRLKTPGEGRRAPSSKDLAALIHGRRQE